MMLLYTTYIHTYIYIDPYLFSIEGDADDAVIYYIHTHIYIQIPTCLVYRAMPMMLAMRIPKQKQPTAGRTTWRLVSRAGAWGDTLWCDLLDGKKPTP